MELYEQHGSVEETEWLLQRRMMMMNHPWEEPHHLTTSADQIMSYDNELLYYNDNLGCYSNNFVTDGQGFSSINIDHGYYPYQYGNHFQVSEAPLSAPTMAESCLIPSMNMMEEEEEEEEPFTDDVAALEMLCKTEPVVSLDTAAGQVLVGQKSRTKKVEGQPSKNLMAERRRRKRLNDRLSMLRSIVPKISKMDRTSILGDTIDYMKELVDKIQKLQEEINSTQQLDILKDMKPNEMVVRNSPKFNVERREQNKTTRVEICCSAGKPGLLLSTVNTLEALGLEIQQCVISSFNDFALHASCSEEVEQRQMVSPEDIKQALFRNAGYGGKCL